MFFYCFNQIFAAWFHWFVCFSFRTHDLDKEPPPLLMIQDKRHKPDPSSIEEELLLSNRLLVRPAGC